MDWVDLDLQPSFIELSPNPTFEGCFSADQLPAWGMVWVEKSQDRQCCWPLLAWAGLWVQLLQIWFFFWCWREVIPKVVVVEGRAGSLFAQGGDAQFRSISLTGDGDHFSWTIMGYEIYSSSCCAVDVSPPLYLLGDRMRLGSLLGWRPVGFHFTLCKLDRTQRPSVLHVQYSSWAYA